LTGKEKVLEIGTGTGRSISSIINLVSSIWILDPSVPMLQQAKEKFPSAKSVLGYAEKLPFDTLRFDRIIAIDSLHHWDNQLGSKFFTPLELRKLHKKAGLHVIRQAYVEAGTYITIARKEG